MNEGDRVYYSIYYDGGYFGEAPKTDQQLGIIETITTFENYYVVTLENHNYTLVLYESDKGKIWKGQAISNDLEKKPTKDDVAKAFITKNYLNYSRETVLHYKKLLSHIPPTETDWHGEEVPNWEYVSTLAELKKFMKRLKDTDYFELYPEDLI